MTDLIPAVSQLGFPVAITTFLLYDYSKKLALIQVEMVKNNIELVKISERLDTATDQLQRIEDKLNGN